MTVKIVKADWTGIQCEEIEMYLNQKSRNFLSEKPDRFATI